MSRRDGYVQGGGYNQGVGMFTGWVCSGGGYVWSCGYLQWMGMSRRGGYGLNAATTRTVGTRAVRILLECFLVIVAASGHYMLATTKFKQPDMVAHIVSPYILAGDNTCIQVYYQTQGGVLNIRTVATDSTLTTGMVRVRVYIDSLLLSACYK